MVKADKAGAVVEPLVVLASGSFVRVRADHPSFRAGKDGMVIEDAGSSVGLYFGYDRHCQAQDVICVGTELWDKAELDLSSVY